MRAWRAGDDRPVTNAERDLAAVQRGIDLFNAGEIDALFADVFDPHVDYAGDPDVSVLTGNPPEGRGAATVRRLWEAFFAMFDEIALSDVRLEHDGPGRVTGSAHMVARGGSSQVPIDGLFHLAWVLAGERWRFMAVKLQPEAATQARRDWEQAAAA